MKFTPTALAGVLRIDLEPRADERGMFARLHCPEEFAAAGIAFTPLQMNLSRNIAKHTLRGMHFQEAPYAEAKVVRVVSGSAYDVAIDLRSDSPTFGRWTAATLTAAGGEALYIPEGCAHGFLTLEAGTDVLYQMGKMYVPGQARGVRWDDPAFGVQWPAVPAVMDARDRRWEEWVG